MMTRTEGTGRFPRSFLSLVALLTFFLSLAQKDAHAEVAWTPIYVDTTNRLDLWTVNSTGCECPDRTSSKCACCVKPGGCLCSKNLNKCAQCGLEDVCQRFCNVSISSRNVAIKSGLSWVHLQSPALEGPASCWWRLEGAPGQRIQVQIHRLLAVGSVDNATQKCVGGLLQFSDGESGLSVSSQAIQLCAQNSRFSPPVVLFGDQGVATLLLRVEAKTSRSQVAAYISFSSADDPQVGDPSTGGRLRPHSVCDWTYDSCWSRECVLASPGFPGLFPPNRRCRYFVSANSTKARIRFHFQSVSLPQSASCGSHHIAIWRRNLTSTSILGRPLKTFCHGTEETVELEGGEALIEFRSGNTLPPYIYNGFRATVKFVDGNHRVTPTPSTLATPLRIFPLDLTTPLHNFEEENVGEPLGYPRASYETGNLDSVSCGHVFNGDLTRGNVFRLIIPRDLTHTGRSGIVGQRAFGPFEPEPKYVAPAFFKCHLEFRGKPADVVQLAVFNYRLRGSNCSTVIQVYDMEEDPTNLTDRLLGKLCGPTGNEVKRFTSSHSRMALIAFIFPHQDSLGTEFLEGAFRFHDESVEGTVKPMSNCEVVYYGVTSSPKGHIIGPPDSPLLRLSTFPLVCAHTFLPGANQSVALTFDRAGHDTENVALPGSRKYCRSFCGSSGCRCESRYTPLDQIDHLSLVTGTTPIACLCGFFPDILPITFESHTPLMLVYHATKGGHEFSYSAKFHFQSKVTCSNFTIGPPSGSMRWREILGPAFVYSRNSQHYTHFQCIWHVHIPHRYKLTLDFVSEENEEDCRTWNLTLWTTNSGSGTERGRSDLLSSFCPKTGRKETKIPDTVQNAYIRLAGVTLRPPQFEIRWKYVDVMLGSGLVKEQKASSSSYPLTRTSSFCKSSFYIVFSTFVRILL